jgi:hypothetical protein
MTLLEFRSWCSDTHIRHFDGRSNWFPFTYHARYTPPGRVAALLALHP